MKFRYLMFAIPLCSAFLVGCGGSGENTIVETTTEVSPSEAEILTEDYEKGMSDMQN